MMVLHGMHAAVNNVRAGALPLYLLPARLCLLKHRARAGYFAAANGKGAP